MEEIAAKSAMRADRAERLLETLQRRNPAEADLQASAMVMAGLKMLQKVRGTTAVLDSLSRLGPALVAECPAEPSPPSPAPATTGEDLVGGMLDYLRGLPLEVAKAQARAAAVASSNFLAEVGAAPAVVVSGPVAEPTAALPVGLLTLAIVDELKTMHRWDAHERARAVVAGAAAYLHEIFGRSYASAVLDGTLQAATNYGLEAHGGRDTCDVLH